MPLIKMSDINKQQGSTPSGLVPMGSISSQPEPPVSNDQPEQQQPFIGPVLSSYSQPDQQSFADRAQSFNAPDANGDYRTNYPGGFFNPLNDLNRLSNSPFVKTLTHSAGQTMGVPEDKMDAAKSTGNNLVDTVAKIIGEGAGYLTNPAQLEQNVSNAFFGNQPVQNLGSKVGSLVESRLPQNVLGRAAANTAEQAAIVGLGSAAYAPFQTLISGQDVQDIPKNVLEQGLSGALLGGAGGALGSLAKSGLRSLQDIIGGVKEEPLPNYSNATLPQGEGSTEHPTLADSKTPDIQQLIVGNRSVPDTALNIDSMPNEPVKLSPQEISRQERIDQFSKIEDNPVIPNTADQIQSKTVKESIPLLDRANDVYIKTVDNAHRTNQFDQTAKVANGSQLNPSDSAYMLQLNARGHDMQSSQIINKNMVNAKGEVTGQSLADITNQIPKGQEQAFNDYVVAQHSIDRMARGEKVYADNKNMTIQKAKAIVDQYNSTNPEFKAISKQYTQFHQDFAQQWYVDTGLFKQSQLDAAKEANPNYVPNKRIFSDLEKKTAYGNSKGGVAGQTNPVKRYGLAGSQRPIVSPLESTIEDVAKGVKTAKNNEAGQAIVRSLQRNPDELSGFAKIVGKDTSMNVDEMIQKDGMEGVIDHLNQQFEDATRNFNREKGNIVTVLVNGEPIKVEIYDPQFLEAISNLSPKGQDYVTAFVGKGTKVMKNLTTGVNPVFGLTRNVLRDIPHAYISSKTTSNPIRFGVDLLDGMTSVLADSMSHSKLSPKFMKGWLETRGALYNDYKNMGGGHSSSIAADRNLLAQSKEKLLPSSGLGQTLKRNLLTKPYHALENLNNAAEAAPRLGEYKRVVKQGGGTYDSRVKGLFEANDLTVNFNKFGNVTKNVDAYIPYLNAAVQGLDQLVRMGTKGGAKRLTQVYTKALVSLTIPTTILYLINHNNPDYQQMSNFIKDNYLLIPNGDGTFTKVAKPRELGMVFSTGVERALRAFVDHDPAAFQDFTTNFLQNFLPPGFSGAVSGFEQNGITGIPTGVLQDTIAGPLVNLGANKDFANRPIVPGDLEKLSPRLQYDSKTSEPAKIIGNLTNTSPKKLDYLVKSYGGVLGQLGIPAATKGSSIKDTLKQQITADPTYSNDISRNFYDAKAKADMAMSDQKASGNAQDNAAYQKYYDRVANQISRLRKVMKAIQLDDSLSKTEKNAQLRDFQQQLNEYEKSVTLK